MAYRKQRKTNYALVQGINQKTSKYNLDDQQVRGLYNMDFNNPGALSKRPGSTQMIGAGTSGAIRSLFEFERLSGESYLMAGSNTELFIRNGTTGFSSIATGFSNGQPEDMLAFLNKAWVANGDRAGSFDGTSFHPVGLPCFESQALSPAFYSSSHSGPFQVFGITSSQDLGAGETFTIAYLMARWERADDDYRSPFKRPDDLPIGGAGGIVAPITPYILGISPKALLGVTTGFINYGQSSIITLNNSFVPSSDYNIDEVALYLYVDTAGVNTSSEINSDTVNPSNGKYKDTFDYSNFRYLTSIPVGVSNQVEIGPFGFSWSDVLNSSTFPAFSGMVGCYFNTYTPRYIEVEDNRLFQAGFSAAPSVVFFSDIGEPEVIQPENFFEVRTDDGDRITGTKSFNNQLLIFKQESFYRLLGDSPDNYTLDDVTSEYGCLSNKAIVEYSDKILFLDKKGVVEYNGASWRIISHPVEETFRRINLSAAIDKAVAVHYDFRNQVWFGIPVDGSTENNLTVVYDYLVGSWTWFDGFNPSAITMAKQELTQDRAWFGDYSGIIHHFSPSFYGDNGQGITCLVQTKFDSPDGENVQNMFRQIFVDNDTPTGATGEIKITALKDYNTSTAAQTFSVFQNQFQTRKDFGVNARSIAFDISHSSASLPLTLYGYTVRRRFLREV